MVARAFGWSYQAGGNGSVLTGACTSQSQNKELENHRIQPRALSATCHRKSRFPSGHYHVVHFSNSSGARRSPSQATLSILHLYRSALARTLSRFHRAIAVQAQKSLRRSEAKAARLNSQWPISNHPPFSTIPYWQLREVSRPASCRGGFGNDVRGCFWPWWYYRKELVSKCEEGTLGI